MNGPVKVSPKAAPVPYHADWYWEGNVQLAIADHLASDGWTIEHQADTAKHEHGDDIRARKDGRTLRVEVKGWPTKGRYADRARAGQVKRTQPSTQAGHWYGDAVLQVIRDLHQHPGDQVAIGLPDSPRFRNLVSGTETPLRQLGVGRLPRAGGPIRRAAATARLSEWAGLREARGPWGACWHSSS